MRKTYLLTKNLVGIREAYLNEIARPAFMQATKGITPHVRQYSIAGKRFQFTYWNQLLCEKMSPAIAHLESSVGEPEVTINLWDSASMNTPLPLPLSQSTFFYEQSTDGKIQLEESFLGTYVPGEEFINLYDIEGGIAYFWVPDAHTIQPWLCAAPVRTLLHWCLARDGVQLVHGACVGEAGRAVLLSAKSGSGKSTTAFACVQAGMEYLADDYVAVDVRNGIKAHSLYSSIKVGGEYVREVPELAPHSMMLSPTEKKRVVFLNSVFSEQVRTSAILPALMIPVITTSPHTTIIPASKQDALLALAPTTLFQLPLAEDRTLGYLKDLVRALPCYFLMLGPNTTEIPSVLRSFLRA